MNIDHVQAGEIGVFIAILQILRIFGEIRSKNTLQTPNLTIFTNYAPIDVSGRAALAERQASLATFYLSIFANKERFYQAHTTSQRL